MKEYIQKLSEQQDLTRREASAVMRIIMEGQATDAQIAALLIALKMKGEHTEELLGFVDVMREKSVKIRVDDPDAIDLCGTGGDNTGTFNISTVSSFVVAGAGVTVAKHGNRGVSSSCGSADVLSELGAKIELTPDKVSACVNTVGIGFLFAPVFHPAMKHAAQPRKDLGITTCFNLLGPMTNPAGVRRQLVGAFSREAAQKIATVFSQLDAIKVLVIHAGDGMDEVSLESSTTVFDVNSQLFDGKYVIEPKAFGLPFVNKASLRGGSAVANASIARRVLEGEKSPCRDIVLANSALGLMVAGKARTVQEGVGLAGESIDSQQALQKLNQFISFTQR